MLDVVFAYKTIERLDESMAEKVAISCYCLRVDGAWGRAKFRRLAQNAFQRIGGEQLVFIMFLVKDIMNRVARAS